MFPLPPFIEKLLIKLSFRKTIGNNSTESSMKAKNITGNNVAARDVNNNTYIFNEDRSQESPYVYTLGAFGGNGHTMHFQVVKVENDSEEMVFLDKISFLEIKHPLNNKRIRAKETTNLRTWDNLTYPTSNSTQWLKLNFHIRNGNKYIAKQKLIFSPRTADNKYDVKLDVENHTIIPDKNN